MVVAVAAVIVVAAVVVETGWPCMASCSGLVWQTL